jgi:peptidoglycan/LPS O-acetylase OafA/YrhL
MGKPTKLLGLEAVRFLSAFAILIGHYGIFAYVGADKHLIAEQQPFYASLSLLYDHGHVGVPIFWCVSGFIFFWKYLEPIASDDINASRFFVLRFSRLYPLHFVTLLAVAALQTVYFARHGAGFVIQNNDLYHFVLQLFMASNWGFETAPSFNFPIWSISVEEVVYLSFFLVARYISASVLVNVVVLSLCVTAKALHIWHPVLDCLGFYYVGGIAALAFLRTRAHQRRSMIDAAALIVAVAVPLLVYHFEAYRLRHFELLFLMAYTPVLLFALAREWRCGARLRTAIEAAGNMTYSSYLLHFPVQMSAVLVAEAMGLALPIYNPLFWGLYLSGMAALSFWCYRAFEKPAQDALRATLLPRRLRLAHPFGDQLHVVLAAEEVGARPR